MNNKIKYVCHGIFIFIALFCCMYGYSNGTDYINRSSTYDVFLGFFQVIMSITVFICLVWYYVSVLIKKIIILNKEKSNVK